MKYFVLAGEASGDKQAALLCEAIRRHDPSAQITGWGGEAMEAQGVNVTRHYRLLAYMGFVEVIRHLPDILKNFKLCRKEILAFNPDALILVDYPGFNLRMAGWAFKKKIPVYYYISPQLWAWHTSRVHKIKKAVRKMFVILPFEKDFYKTYGMDVMYIGHPLALEMQKSGSFNYSPQKGHIGLLPGSRKHEIDRMLPEMANVVESLPLLTFHVIAVPHLPKKLYEEKLRGLKNVVIHDGKMKENLSQCEAAIVTSGTATLETALLGVPQIVVYKGSEVSYQIARRLIHVKYISLVNLIMDQPLVPELIQSECEASKIKVELEKLLLPDRQAAIHDGYAKLRQLLSSGGGAEAAAIDIIADLDKTNQH